MCVACKCHSCIPCQGLTPLWWWSEYAEYFGRRLSYCFSQFYYLYVFIFSHFSQFFISFCFIIFSIFFARSFVSWLQFLGEGIHPWEKTVSVGTGHQWAMPVIWLLGDKGLGDSHSKIDVWDLPILSKCIALNWISTLILQCTPYWKSMKNTQSTWHVFGGIGWLDSPISFHLPVASFSAWQHDVGPLNQKVSAREISAVIHIWS